MHQNSVVQNDKKAEEVKDYIKNRIRVEIRDFSNLSFINPKDQHFVHNFLKNKSNADKNLVQFIIYCYIYLLKHHNVFYPWYAKSFFKKINFLRKQCMY